MTVYIKCTDSDVVCSEFMELLLLTYSYTVILKKKFNSDN